MYWDLKKDAFLHYGLKKKPTLDFAKIYHLTINRHDDSSWFLSKFKVELQSNSAG
jgi:hypothetical protein